MPQLRPCAALLAAALAASGGHAAEHELARRWGAERSAGRSSASGTLRGRMLQPGFVAPYIPKVGVSNVTTPTMLPPPPPVVNTITDVQPIDTDIGLQMVGPFFPAPTVTPPPTQDAVNLAFSCEAILAWPQQLQVSVPKDCGSSWWPYGTLGQGSWSATGDNVQAMTWEEECRPWTWFSMLPTVRYNFPSGSFFGYSRTKWTLVGNRMELVDCSLQVAYTIDEKVIKQTGKVDTRACRDYGSCDGTVYLQYMIYDKSMTLVATTPFLTLFQNTFTISDPAGLEIAKITRMGDWKPATPDCSDGASPTQWLIQYATTPPGVFLNVNNQWPIAEMMNMFGARDAQRRPSGMVFPTKCEVVNLILAICFWMWCLVVSVILYCLFTRICLPPLRGRLLKVEQATFPRKMC